jgi:hypothetical protein
MKFGISLDCLTSENISILNTCGSGHLVRGRLRVDDLGDLGPCMGRAETEAVDARGSCSVRRGWWWWWWGMPVNRRYARDPLMSATRCGPPQIASRCPHSTPVLESIQIGPLALAKLPFSCSLRLVEGDSWRSVARAPRAQNTDACCWPLQLTAATRPRSELSPACARVFAGVCVRCVSFVSACCVCLRVSVYCVLC